MDPIVDGADGVGFQSAFARALAQASVRRSKHSQALQLAAPLPPDAAPDENINLQLKEECERLMEENRRLKASAVLSSHLNIDHEQRAEVTLLQSKVNTLAWQLSQSESRRRMVCSVAEQVVTFLDRVAKTLNNNNATPDAKQRSNSARCRVPRSRSTHSSEVKEVLEREFSPRTSLQRSQSQMHSESEFTLNRRRTSTISIEEAENEKLSQQAHRLARTMKSMLNSQEPPAVASESPSSSFSELLRMTSRRRLNYDLPEKPLIVQQQESSTPVRPPLPSDVTYISPLMQHQQDSTSTCSSNSSSSSSPTLKARDSDESGFSSIGSFQEVGLPSPNEMIIPRHTRCRSTPSSNNKFSTSSLHNFYNESSQLQNSLEISALEKLKVLWV